MFSHKDLPLEAETLEYGWLIELTVGDLKVIGDSKSMNSDFK